MDRRDGRWTILTVVLLLLAPAPGWAGDSARYSGTVLEVNSQSRTVVLEEQVAWRGPGTGLVRRTVTVTPATSIQLVQPSEEWGSDARPGYSERPIAPADLRPGDFVTVATESTLRPVAVSMDVVRP